MQPTQIKGSRRLDLSLNLGKRGKLPTKSGECDGKCRPSSVLNSSPDHLTSLTNPNLAVSILACSVSHHKCSIATCLSAYPASTCVFQYQTSASLSHEKTPPTATLSAAQRLTALMDLKIAVLVRTDLIPLP